MQAYSPAVTQQFAPQLGGSGRAAENHFLGTERCRGRKRVAVPKAAKRFIHHSWARRAVLESRVLRLSSSRSSEGGAAPKTSTLLSWGPKKIPYDRTLQPMTLLCGMWLDS